jgi:Autotransporter beta-domain
MAGKPRRAHGGLGLTGLPNPGGACPGLASDYREFVTGALKNGDGSWIDRGPPPPPGCVHLRRRGAAQSFQADSGPARPSSHHGSGDGPKEAPPGRAPSGKWGAGYRGRQLLPRSYSLHSHLRRNFVAAGGFRQSSRYVRMTLHQARGLAEQIEQVTGKRRSYFSGLMQVVLAFLLSLAGTLPAGASICSTADPSLIPGGTVFETVTAEFINQSLGQTTTPPFAIGTPAYRIVNTEPFVTIRTHLYNPNDLFLGAPGSFSAPLALFRGLTPAQLQDRFVTPLPPVGGPNNATAIGLIPAGTTIYSGLTGPITGPNGALWGTGDGGAVQYYLANIPRAFQVPQQNWFFSTPFSGGPVLVYGPRLSGNARAIGSYLDRACVVAFSDLDRVLTTLDLHNLATPTDPGPLSAAINQLSPDRYGALPLIIRHQHTLVLDAFGGRIDATRYSSPHMHQQALAPGFAIWGQATGDFGRRGGAITMPGYRTTAVGGLAGADYRTNGFVFGLGAGYLASDVTWRDIGRSTGSIDTAVAGAYAGATFGLAVLEGAVAATYSDIDVNRRIVIPGVELIGLNRQPDPGSFRFSTAIDRTALARPEAMGFAARLDLGTELQLAMVRFKPFVGLTYGTIDREAFVESGAGAASLRVADQVSDGLHSRLGALVSYDISGLGPLGVSLQGRLVWSHRLSASESSVTAGLMDQLGAFTVATAKEDQHALQPGLALVGRFNGGEVFARYGGDFREGFRAHTFTGGVASRF